MERNVKQVDAIEINNEILSAYIVSVDNNPKIVMALNISDACDKLDEMGFQHYKIKKSRSIDIIY